MSTRNAKLGDRPVAQLPTFFSPRCGAHTFYREMMPRKRNTHNPQIPLDPAENFGCR